MHALTITGGDAERLADRLLGHLEGRTALVRADDLREDATRRPDGGVGRTRAATTTVDVGTEGVTVRGERPSLGAVLDRLAPDHDYAVVLGAPDARLPRVVLGEGDADDDDRTLLAAPDASAVDVDELAAALDDAEPHVTLEALVADVKRSPLADRAGAIATFTGRVRARDAEDDAPTEYLEFEKYDGVAERRSRDIEADLEARDGVLEVAMHHRTGVVPDGEDIVFVVVLAGHRREAFRAVEDGIDRLKDEVPIFKKEVTAEETFWVHERE